MKDKTKLGLSLSWTYLANEAVGRCSHLWNGFFGRSEHFLEVLEKQGISSIEFRHFDEVESEKIIHAVAATMASTPLGVTVHGDINFKKMGKSLFEIFPWFPILLEKIPDKMDGTVITLHPVLSPDGDHEKARELTRRMICDLLEMSDKENLTVRYTLEIQRSKGLPDPGTTYDGILDMHKRVGNPLLGVNWDMGHAQSNVEQGLLPTYPEREFLSQVTHTHIHDLSPRGKTHWPLTMGRVPLESNIRILAEQNYKGIYNLELGPDRFYTEKDARESILKSISTLKETVHKAVGKTVSGG
jgi:sugar phosphate isomerase/epimerase